MTAKSALSGINSLLDIIRKSSAPDADKLDAIRDLAEGIRSDILDMAEAEYASYIEPEGELTFDMVKAVEDLTEAFRLQIFYNLYDYYSVDRLRDEVDPFVRVAICKALIAVGQEQNRELNPIWANVLTYNGILPEVN